MRQVVNQTKYRLTKAVTDYKIKNQMFNNFEPDTYFDAFVNSGNKKSKFLAGDLERISEHKNVVLKIYRPIWLEKFCDRKR